MVNFESAREEFIKQPYSMIESLGKGTPDQELYFRTSIAQYLEKTFGYKTDPANEKLDERAKDMTGKYYLPMFMDSIEAYVKRKPKGALANITQFIEKFADGYEARKGLDSMIPPNYLTNIADIKALSKGTLSEERSRSLITPLIDEIFEQKGKISKTAKRYISDNSELKQIIVNAYVNDRNIGYGSKALHESIIGSAINKSVNEAADVFIAYNTKMLKNVLTSNKKTPYQIIGDVSQITMSLDAGLQKEIQNGHIQQQNLEDITETEDVPGYN